jgi:hypothetical protein
MYLEVIGKLLKKKMGNCKATRVHIIP